MGVRKETHSINETYVLVGKYFHTTKKCPSGIIIASLQGHILDSLKEGIILIETFEWLMGEPYGQEIWTLEKFIGLDPILYDTDEEMKYSYEYGRLQHSHKCKGEKCNVR